MIAMDATNTDGDDGARTEAGSARRRLARALSEKFGERNFALSYIARRCRTLPDVVQSWVSAIDLPTEAEWDWLLCVSRDFLVLNDLYYDACTERYSLEEASSSVSDADPRSEPPGGDTQCGIAETTSVARPATPSPAFESSSPGLDRPRGSMVLSETPGGAQGTLSVERPVGYEVFPCKISGGRLVQLILPIAFSRVDALRIQSFLMTQVDDPEALDASDPPPGVRSISGDRRP